MPWAHRDTEGADARDRAAVLAVLLAALPPLALAALRREAGPTAAPARRRRCALMLDYLPNADHAGIYAAQASGEFAQGRASTSTIAHAVATPPRR